MCLNHTFDCNIGGFVYYNINLGYTQRSKCKKKNLHIDFCKQLLGVKKSGFIQNRGGIHYLNVECIILLNTGNMF